MPKKKSGKSKLNFDDRVGNWLLKRSYKKKRAAKKKKK